MPDDCRGTEHEQSTQIRIALLGDAALALFAAAAVLFRHNSIQAAKCRAERNCDASPTVATMALAEIGPTPGMAASRRLTSCAVPNSGMCPRTALISVVRCRTVAIFIVDGSLCPLHSTAASLADAAAGGRGRDDHAGRPPTDPGVRCYRTGLLPRMFDEEPLFRPWVQDAWIWQVRLAISFIRRHGSRCFWPRRRRARSQRSIRW